MKKKSQMEVRNLDCLCESLSGGVINATKPTLFAICKRLSHRAERASMKEKLDS